jgi:CRP-like cAMP-binding protein
MAVVPRSAASYAAVLHAGRWFADLDDDFRRELLDCARVRTLRDGEVLFVRGDPPTGLFAVVDGAIRVTAVTEAGREVVLTRMEPPAWFGEIAVFDGHPRTHDAVADGATVVVHVPQAELHEVLGREPRWWRDLGVLVAAKLRLSFVAMEEAAALPLAARLARRLVLLAEGHGEHMGHRRRVVAIAQEQLASMLGASRQSVNAALKDWESRGVLRLQYGQIEIVDVDALRGR